MVKKRTLRIPLNAGKEVKDENKIGVIIIRATDKQASILPKGILVPNYDINSNGEFEVTSYNIVPRTDVLRPEHLKRIAEMELRGLDHYEKEQQLRRDGNTGDRS